MAKTPSIRLRLSGQGIQIDKEVSSTQAHQIVALILGTTQPSSASSDSGKASVPHDTMPAGSTTSISPSVREFLLQQEAKRIPEQITSIGAWLKTHRNVAVFTRKDLVKGFEDAQEPVPKNLARDINWTVRIGWIAPKSGQKNAYYVTALGDTAVGAKFPRDIKQKTRVTAGNRRKRRKQTKQPK